jgi:hypothetical protein
MFDHLVNRLALGARNGVPHPFGLAHARCVHRDIGVALIEIELNGNVAGTGGRLRNDF